MTAPVRKTAAKPSAIAGAAALEGDGAAGAHAGARRREPAGLGEPRGDRGTGAARDEDGEDRRLHAREVVLQRVTDANRGAPGHLPAAAGEVRRLVQREPGVR